MTGRIYNNKAIEAIHVTQKFFEASGRRGDFFEKNKNQFLDELNGSMCAKFQVSIVYRLARRRGTKNTQIHKYTHIQVKLRISSTGCTLHVDFDKAIKEICQNPRDTSVLFLGWLT